MDSSSSGAADGRPGSVRPIPWLAAALLPVVRRTLQVGDGPAWVVAVVRSAGITLAARAGWTLADERLARRLARQAAQLLVNPDDPGQRETVPGEGQGPGGR